MTNFIIVRQGCNLVNPFVGIEEEHILSIQQTTINAHTILRISKRYHQHLRNTMRKMLLGHSRADLDHCLSLYKLGPEYLVTKTFFFGKIPQLLDHHYPGPIHHQMNAYSYKI